MKILIRIAGVILLGFSLLSLILIMEWPWFSSVLGNFFLLASWLFMAFFGFLASFGKIKFGPIAKCEDEAELLYDENNQKAS